MTQVPLPPPEAQRFNTVCQFCIVGCGYRVFKWPIGADGGPAPQANALGVDFREPQPAFGEWIAPAMHSVVKDADGRDYNIAILPDAECQVNQGLAHEPANLFQVEAIFLTTRLLVGQQRGETAALVLVDVVVDRTFSLQQRNKHESLRQDPSTVYNSNLRA